MKESQEQGVNIIHFEDEEVLRELMDLTVTPEGHKVVDWADLAADALIKVDRLDTDSLSRMTDGHTRRLIIITDQEFPDNTQGGDVIAQRVRSRTDLNDIQLIGFSSNASIIGVDINLPK